ncbi:hypothetical protein U1Q18_014893 [Sarracenia purpurea var. burkii]
MRPLGGEQWLKSEGLAIQSSLQRGPVPASKGGNPCTNIPGNGRGRCTLAETEMNFSGQFAHAPPAFPNVMVKFAAASNANIQ